MWLFPFQTLIESQSFRWGWPFFGDSPNFNFKILNVYIDGNIVKVHTKRQEFNIRLLCQCLYMCLLSKIWSFKSFVYTEIMTTKTCAEVQYKLWNALDNENIKIP